MNEIDDLDEYHGLEDNDSLLQDAYDEEMFETSVHAVATIGGTPGWEAYQRYGYSIWRFDGQSWQVMVSRCADGAVCGLPPKEAGQYVGEHRKKNCEPAPVTADLRSAAVVGVES